MRRGNNRYKEAVERGLKRIKRSDSEQLKILSSRPGNSLKEKTRLNKKISGGDGSTAS
jgi:hypothetical protein